MAVVVKPVSNTAPAVSLGLSELRDWLVELGLSLQPEAELPVREQLRDGVLLCQLVNKLKPGSVETVS